MKALAAALILVSALAPSRTSLAQIPADNAASLRQAEAAITPAHLLQHIQTLASDAYTGRAPGTEGETKSVAYIIAQCRAIGLQPGNPDGSWTQTVKLWGMLPQANTLTLTADGQPQPLVSGTDYAAWSAMPVAKLNVGPTGLVFVGYGVIAPEFHWDDYADVDVHGKTVVFLSGDPPVTDPADPSKLDDSMFLGRALTVYGRTGTKFDTAWKHGATAAILVSPTPQPAPALFQNYAREIMTIRGPHDRDRVQAQALLSLARASQLFSTPGASFDSLRAAAAKPGFHAVPLAGEASFIINSRVRPVDSANVVAKIPGSDSALRNQYVIYSGHWDHYGQVGSQIYHGASDNAAGTAGVLELARAFKTLHPAPRRSILFLWPTAEEKGLLGARFYVEHPLYPSPTPSPTSISTTSATGAGAAPTISVLSVSATPPSTTSPRSLSTPRAALSPATPLPNRASTSAPTTTSSPAAASPPSKPAPASTTSANLRASV